MNRFCRTVILFLCVCLAFTGCSAVSSIIGTLNVDVNQVTAVSVTTASGNTFTTQDQQTVREIVNAVNRLNLENEGENINGYLYAVTLEGADVTVTIHSETCVSYESTSYNLDAASLLHKVRALECDTMTDAALIQTIFEVEYVYFSDLRDAEGNISIDKILSLGDRCPAAFELISRPSAAESLGSYGLDLLKKYLNSSDINLKARAQEVAEFIASLAPALEEKIDEILETTAK